MHEVIELMKAHRSIRKFQPKPLDDSMVKEIIKTGQMASTSSFVQAYTIIGIKNDDTKNQLAVLAGDQAYIRGCPLFLVFCADLHRLERVCANYNISMVGEYTE